ncbi:hypothetical protein F7734_52030 [Scytonema sp. UIC 10036]|nr:hypothetical protein [Scytonema sp. UIC 10036]
MNQKFLWATKHWGLGVGASLAVVGIVLAAPENMNTWRRVEKTSEFFGQTYTESTYIRMDEIIPQGYEVTALAYGRHEMKALGAGLLFLGSAMVWGFAQALVPEYERLEKTNHRIRKSEFELEDIQIQQNTEVARWSIELDAQSDISKMLNPPKPYIEESVEDEEESEQKALEGAKFSDTYTGFLGWLQSKEIRQATVRDLAQKSFNGKKIPSEQIRKWVDELCVDGLAEWLDEEKKEFRLLNQ